MIQSGQDLDLLIKEVANLFKEQKQDNKVVTESKYQSPIKGAWYNSGDFYPGVYLNDRHTKGHDGVDMRAPGGTEVYPLTSGIVTKVGADSKGGNFINIQHDNNVRSYYAHLGTVLVSQNAKVNNNTIIGTVGDSGNAKGTPPHLHFQVWQNGSVINPKKFFNVPAYSKVNKNETSWLNEDAKNNAKNFNMQFEKMKTKKAVDNDINRLVKIINELLY